MINSIAFWKISYNKRSRVYAKAAWCTHFTEDDFGSEVFGRTTQGPGSALHALSKAKVCHLKISIQHHET